VQARLPSSPRPRSATTVERGRQGHNSWDVGTLYGRPKDVWCYLGFREVMDKKAGQTIFCLTTSMFSNSIDYRLDTPISSVVRNKQRHISLDNSKSLDLYKTISSIDHVHFFSK
jgi:hypothetical protein